MISVIIATYNYGRYISDALRSLQKQSFKDWECIVVDDGSTDNTKEVVEKFRTDDSRINYFFKVNEGPTAARNVGIKMAKGEFVLFLDADDILQKNKLISHLKEFEIDKQLDVAYGNVRYFLDGDFNHEHFFFSLKPANKLWIPEYSGNGQGLLSTVLRQNIMVTSSPLIRKSSLDRIGWFDAKLKKLEDWELFQRMAIHNLNFKYVSASESLVLMRSHTSSFSYNKIDMRSYLLPILQKHFFESKVGGGNKVYLIVRMIEEYTDLVFLKLTSGNTMLRHYYNFTLFLMPFLALVFLPFYIFIKIFRLIGGNK